MDRIFSSALDKLRKDASERTTEIADLRRQLEEAKAEIERAIDGIRYWTKQCASLVSQIEIANAEIERLRGENEALVKAVHAACNQLEKFEIYKK